MAYQLKYSSETILSLKIGFYIGVIVKLLAKITITFAAIKYLFWC
jgi:hypothetical protein